MVRQELDSILEAERGGFLYADEPFNALEPGKRGVRDIAFSGDGEPTTFPRFERAVQIAAQARLRFGLDFAKIILITNAAFLNKPSVSSALTMLDRNNGEIWAKLDAGTEEYFRIVNRSREPFQQILDNILNASRIRPLIIQSLWFRIRNESPSTAEIDAYCARLNDILSGGGTLQRVQLYTVARIPAEAAVAPLSPDELDRIAEIVKRRVATPIEVF
jgi:wyosine [tRNA(Phe)-imidazoG37] synthetase (radical SAM superfamily)